MGDAEAGAAFRFRSSFRLADSAAVAEADGAVVDSEAEDLVEAAASVGSAGEGGLEVEAEGPAGDRVDLRGVSF